MTGRDFQRPTDSNSHPFERRSRAVRACMAFTVCASCARPPTRVDGVVESAPDRQLVGAGAVMQPETDDSGGPRFGDLPRGWTYACSALNCARMLVYDAGSPGVRWREAGPTYELDPSALASENPSCAPEEPRPIECSVAVDLDSDGKTDRVSPIRGPDARPGLAVAWGNAAPTEAFFTEAGGHISPVVAPSLCATTLQTLLYEHDVSNIDELEPAAMSEVFPAASSHPTMLGFRLPSGAWLGLDGQQWRVATSMNRVRDASATAVAEPWTAGEFPRRCAAARKIRKRRYREHVALQWYHSGDVATDSCELFLDLDGDGDEEVAAWVVVDDEPGLHVSGLGGRSALVGGGRPSIIPVLDGEPGCNVVQMTLGDVWNADVARWEDDEWTLPDGRTYAPSDPNRVGGDAVALVNAQGHVDLLFVSEGEWRSIAVPFDWHRYLVFWPAMNQWNWVPKPLPSMSRYLRPSPAHHSWVRTHSPGPRPKTAEPFYPGH